MVEVGGGRWRCEDASEKDVHMNRRMVGLAGALALVGALGGCRDASVAPRGDAAPGPPAFAVGGQPTVQSHFVGNGDGGRVEWFIAEGDSLLWGSISVTRGMTRLPAVEAIGPSFTGTYLFYDLQRCDAQDTCTDAYGYGFIPDGDLEGSGRNELRLRTNTAGLPDFYNSGAGGLVTVEWKRNGLWAETRSYTDSYRFGPVTERRQGTYTNFSSTASGEVLGVTVPLVTYAEIGTGHTLRIDIVRGGEP